MRNSQIWDSIIYIYIYNIVNYIYKEVVSQYYTCTLSYLDRLNIGFYKFIISS